jgi:hypothetical protein
MIPNDSRQTEYLFSDGGHPHVNVAIRRAPKPSKPASSRIIDHLERPTKLSYDIGIGQCGHMRVSPGMDGDIILIGLEGGIEFLPVLDDIYTDEKVRCLDLILLKKGVESIGWLYEMCADA